MHVSGIITCFVPFDSGTKFGRKVEDIYTRRDECAFKEKVVMERGEGGDREREEFFGII